MQASTSRARVLSSLHKRHRTSLSWAPHPCLHAAGGPINSNHGNLGWVSCKSLTNGMTTFRNACDFAQQVQSPCALALKCYGDRLPQHDIKTPHIQGMCMGPTNQKQASLPHLEEKGMALGWPSCHHALTKSHV